MACGFQPIPSGREFSADKHHNHGSDYLCNMLATKQILSCAHDSWSRQVSVMGIWNEIRV
jgi:hypothetical protein